jgi:predicted dehydrogenase
MSVTKISTEKLSNDLIILQSVIEGDKPRLPKLSPANKQRGVGIIGAGWIVDVAHLPAYQSIQGKVLGIYDIDPARSRDLADRHAVPNVYSSIEEMLANDDIEVVDIAVPPMVQEEIVPPIARSGRHILAQKPLAMSSAGGRNLVDIADDSRVRLAVNVNMRWAPAFDAVKRLVDADQFGRVTGVSIVTSFWDEWKMWPWLHDFDRLMIRQNAIHLIDWLRHLFGEAESIYATTSTRDDAVVIGDTNVVIVIRFPGGFTAHIHDSADNWAGDAVQDFRVEGTELIVKGTLGIWEGYPPGRCDTLDYCHRSEPGRWHSAPLQGQWAYDAFAWTFGELMESIETGRTPMNCGRDHLRTLEYVEAAYKSAETGQSVRLN